MQFPEKPTCHPPTGAVFVYGNTFEWKPAETGPGQSHPDNDGPFRPFRTCSYCGSIHPEDLIAAIEAGASLGGSDWKYGWPHKFYVTGIPHETEDVEVVTSSTYRNGVREVLTKEAMGKAWGKWYNEHLQDEGFDDEAFNKLTELLGMLTSIEFRRDEKGLGYSAPYRGYQIGSRSLEQYKTLLKEVEQKGKDKLDGE